MEIQLRRLIGPLAVGAALLVVGCNDDGDSKTPFDPPEGAVSDFSLVDVNPNSASHGRSVSPRDCLGRISAWYFGYAT